jgi:predicted RNA-binding protein YlqC (UPF0109 family)
MKELVEYIAKALVDHPESVAVTELTGEKTSIYELRVHTEDTGKVIGKQGRTARAIRTLVSAAATKLNKRAMVEIME